MRPFPEIFDPVALIGVRGRWFPRREDAFQQLVGDGLRELRGGLGVHVSPTRGRDGSIDVLIEPSTGGNDRCLPLLPKPLIVECKDHDEGGRDLRKNVLAGWISVAKRLERQAAQGWPGNYAPWRSARAYVYAVSARLPAAQLRVDLRDQIVAFFAALPGGPPLERVEVLDWSNLRALWDGAPRLADRWLGVGLETLLGHTDQIERFTGFRSYLLEANLPFLAPPRDDPAHPDALLARLSEPGRERGLLLEGPGGVGKSRTLVEIAVRADAAGWRVLHAQAGEPALADVDLEETVLAGSGPTLAVLDYLDQMQLDLVRLRQRLLPAAAARGIRLALIANARPGSDQPSAAREDLFDVVPFRPTAERARAIADRLLATVAPRVLERLGYGRLAELCGTRPIVALFIAREVERRAATGTLYEERLAGVRSGDLTSWLRRRLAESDLAVPPAPSRLEPASPSPQLVAAAALLAAAPQPEAALAAAGERALLEAGLDSRVDPSERSRWLIAILREMGWLEARDGELATAHDVVADEVVHDVLADRSAAIVRRTELEALLAPALGSACTLGRLAVALRRVLGMEGLAASVAAGLVEASAAWLAREAAGLGRLLPRADADEVSFALGAVVQGPPWGQAALDSWDHLFAPFLAVHAERPATRHLLYRGLSALPPGRGALLFPAAHRWLERNGHLPEASFVLPPLLRRDDLDSGEARFAVARALEWLKADREGMGEDFVLRRLLSRNDLSAEDRLEAGLLAAKWVRSHPSAADASFLLKELLSRKDLAPEVAQAAVGSGVVWFETNAAHPQADFVFSRLLRRTELEGERRLQVVRLGIEWLRQALPRDDRDFVLNSLLRSAGRLDQSERQFLVHDTADWLALAPRNEETVARLETTLNSLEQSTALEFFYLTEELAEQAKDAEIVPAVTWLSSALQQVDSELQGEHRASAGYALSSLLPLAARVGDRETLGRVRGLVERFWSEVTLLPKNRIGFVTACYRYLDEGAWPDREAGKRVLASLGIERLFAPAGAGALWALEKEAVLLAASAGPLPSPDWLDLALVETAKPIEMGFPKASGFLFPPLLALAAHFGSATTREVLAGQIHALLANPSFSENGRMRFSLACYRFVDEGAWPDREEGARVLVSLGIERPASEQGHGMTAPPQVSDEGYDANTD